MPKFVNEDGNIILNLNHSSEESFTGMYWIDGKKIYRKYIDFNISSSSYDYTHNLDRKSTRLNSSHIPLSRMPSSA